MDDLHTPAPRYLLRTFGCQMNELDSDKMARLLDLEGWEAARSLDDADAIIVNTCTVREKPAHKVESLLGEYRLLKADRPSLRLVVAGCYAVQQGRDLLARHPFVDAVIGPDAVGRIGDVLRRAALGRVVDVRFDDQAEFVAEPVRRDAGVKAFVAIQRGCDHGCSYCIVPRVRGAERYRPPRAVLEEVSALAGRGVREITLLGQNVNRYRGAEAAGGGERWTFARLLAEVADRDDALRVRFLTSNPWDLGDDLLDVLASRSNVCPSLHLPVQSGSDEILSRMGRPHTARDYLDLVERVRRARPGIGLSSDIMVGFPGETEEDHRATVDLVERVRFTGLFVFAYSPRPGTPASRLPDDVPDALKRTRLREILALQEGVSSQQLRRLVGRTVRVLLEARGRDRGELRGRTPDFWLVHVPAPASWIGREVDVVVEQAMRHTLRGRLARAPGDGGGPVANAGGVR